MAGVAREVPPLPPIDIIPSNLPSLYSLGTIFSIAFDITSVANALSFFAAIFLISSPISAATNSFDTSVGVKGSKTPQ